MKLGARLTITISCLSFLTIALISVTLLSRARVLQTHVAYENLQNMASAEASRMMEAFETNMAIIDSISKVYNSFESIAPANRRPYLDMMIRSIVQSNPEIIGVYSVWATGIIGDGGPATYSTLFSREWSPPGQDIVEYRDFSIHNPGEYNRVQAAIVNGERSQWIRSSPIYFAAGDVFTVLQTAPIINPQSGALYGFVGSRVAIDAINVHIANFKPYGSGRAMIISNEGFIIAHPDANRIGQQFGETEAEYFGEEGLRIITNDTLVDGEYGQFRHNGNIVVSAPFTIGNTGNNWSLILDAPQSAVLAEVNELSTFTVIAAVIILVLTSLFVFRIITRSTKPVTKITAELKYLSEGDLTRKMAINHHKSKDEISHLSIFFNETVGSINSMVSNIQHEATALDELGLTLTHNTAQAASAMNEISANIQSIKQRIINQSASVTETNATMEQITVNINKLSQHVETNSASVAQASSAIEQMLANVHSVTQTLIKNSQNVIELSNASEAGRGGLQEVASDIQEIARESEGLMEINAVIDNIASQTNLLSMNAAIEAAHAGDSGKGFSVVADEIRKLAENSSEQSKTINVVLKKIASSISKITASTDDVIKRFEAIDTGVKTVAQQEENIRNAMEEQGAGSKQILEAISLVNETTQLVKDVSNEMLVGAKEVIREAHNLESATVEITGGINEMAIGAQEVNNAVDQVNELSNKNHAAIGLLSKEVARFKVA